MPRIKRKIPKVRLNLDLPQTLKDQIEQLRYASHADSLSEVIRRSLAIYDYLVTENSAGSTIIVRHKDGTESRIALLL